MTRYDFELLDKQDKIEFIIKNGEYLHGRIDGRFLVYLFSLNDFFVDIWSTDKNDGILYIRSFKNTEYLEEFLSTIELEELF